MSIITEIIFRSLETFPKFAATRSIFRTIPIHPLSPPAIRTALEVQCYQYRRVARAAVLSARPARSQARRFASCPFSSHCDAAPFRTRPGTSAARLRAAGTSAFAADTPLHEVVLKKFLIRFGLRILQSVKCVFRYAFFDYENVSVLLLPSIPPPAPSPQPSGKVGPATSRSAVE